jgi:hypothetical protein
MARPPLFPIDRHSVGIRIEAPRAKEDSSRRSAFVTATRYAGPSRTYFEFFTVFMGTHGTPAGMGRAWLSMGSSVPRHGETCVREKSACSAGHKNERDGCGPASTSGPHILVGMMRGKANTSALNDDSRPSPGYDGAGLKGHATGVLIICL